MARPFKLKQNDLSRSLKWRPSAVTMSDFTGATLVFNMRAAGGGAVKISRAAATIGSDAKGTYFLYNWQPGDTDTAGDFEGEFEATLAGGLVETYPNDDYIEITIMDDIA